eukprot:10523774-Ditylum_brightwellii.AAC.1
MVALSDQAELIRWHYRLQHLSFLKLAMLAKVGLLPSKLDQVRPPSCTHCVYASMTRRPWRGKQTLNTCHKIKTCPTRRTMHLSRSDGIHST